MRLIPSRWHAETWVCSIRGHVAPAAKVRRLRPEDREVGIDTGDGRRLSRCLRCDSWIQSVAPTVDADAPETLPPAARLPKPRRGQPLADAILLRLIAIDRGVHSVIFGLLAILLFVLDSRLPAVQTFARNAVDKLDTVAGQSGRPTDDVLSRELHRLVDLRRGSLTVLAITATVYCVVEGVEAFGLWREKRWAEYLTVVATAGFLPFEIHELLDRVSVLRVGALVVNVAVLIWLVRAKHLFGVGRSGVT